MVLIDYNSVALSPHPSIKPGQLWMWDLSVQDGIWMFATVTSEDNTSPTVEMIKRGETFVIVSINVIYPDCLTEHPIYHVALLHDKLVWIKDDDFFAAKLLR